MSFGGQFVTVMGGGLLGPAVIADFTRSNSEYLSHADDATLSFSGDFHLCVWARIKSKPGAQQAIVTKFSASQREWELEHLHTTDRFRIVYDNDGGGGSSAVSADQLGAPALNTLYFIEIFHYAGTGAGGAGIRVNRGTADTGTALSTLYDGTSEFRIGAFTSGNYLDGGVGPLVIFDSQPSAAILDNLYNSGSPLLFANLSAAAQSAALHAWDLDEASGTRAAAKWGGTGDGTLTDNNTVGSAAP